jgi:hypothetical protein
MFTWKNSRRPNKEEKKWHEMLWGPIRTHIFFANYDKTLKSLKREGKRQRNKAKKAIEVNIKKFDEAMPKELKRISEEKYHDVIANYPYPSNMLLEIVYPQFLRELHERHTWL